MTGMFGHSLQERLLARKDTSWTYSELVRFCEAEEAHGTDVVRAMNIPMRALDMPSSREVEDWLERFSSSARH